MGKAAKCMCLGSWIGHMRFVGKGWVLPFRGTLAQDLEV